MAHNKKKALVFWSSGKDACLALHRIFLDPSFHVVGLMTTLNENTRCVDFHDVSEEQLKAQADSLSLPLDLVALPPQCPNREYETRITEALKNHARAGVTHLIFGDLFLSDIRKYRESFLEPLGFKLVFPLWNQNTLALAREFIQLGYRAILTGVHSPYLSDNYLGHPFSEEFLKSIPPQVDPCGENGEFHTFVYEGPLFRTPISLGSKPKA